MKMQQAGQFDGKSECAWLGLALSHKSTAKWAEIRYYGKWRPGSFRPKFRCLAQKYICVNFPTQPITVNPTT